MQLNIQGDPGTGNRYDEVSMESVASYNPNAHNVNIHNYQAARQSRLAGWFQKLKDESTTNMRLNKKLDDIKRYRTKLPRTIGLEAKLRDGGFSATEIETAKRSKMYFAKKSTKFQFYESAQRIDSYLFAKVAHSFDTYVMPLINSARPLADVKQAVFEHVVSPIVDELNDNGYDDDCLCYDIDNIYGMLYYLTGNCHINWTNYDVHTGI